MGILVVILLSLLSFTIYMVLLSVIAEYDKNDPFDIPDKYLKMLIIPIIIILPVLLEYKTVLIIDFITLSLFSLIFFYLFEVRNFYMFGLYDVVVILSEVIILSSPIIIGNFFVPGVIIPITLTLIYVLIKIRKTKNKILPFLYYHYYILLIYTPIYIMSFINFSIIF